MNSIVLSPSFFSHASFKSLDELKQSAENLWEWDEFIKVAFVGYKTANFENALDREGLHPRNWVPGYSQQYAQLSI